MCRCRILDHRDKLKQLPIRALEEVVRFCTAPGEKPSLLAQTSLVKSGSKYTLAVTLHAPSFGRDIVSPIESFPKAQAANRRRHGVPQTVVLTHPIKSCLQLMLSSNKHWVAMNESLNRPTSDHLSLGNVMSTIEASPDVPSCIQPVGLHDIQLHEYQKCAPICSV